MPSRGVSDVHPLWRASALALERVGRRDIHVSERAGSVIAVCDQSGTIADPNGQVLVYAPAGYRPHQRRPKGTDVKADLYDAWQRPLGELRVVSYSYGPRSRKATIGVFTPEGEVARVEPRDKRGEEIAVRTPAGDVGELRASAKNRWELDLTGALDGLLRALVVTAAVRYPGLRDTAVNTAAHD